MRKIVVLLVLINLSSFMGFGQISFYKVFSNNGYDFGQGAVQLEDSSYVITGSSSSFVDGPSEAFLLKLDSLGNYIWSNHYGGSESDWGRRVLYKKNFGFFIAGYTNSMGNGGYDFYLVKTDESGAQEWQKTYGGTEWERVNSAALTRDTGTIMVGESNSTLNGDNDIFIVRTDKSGDTLWTKKIGGSGEDKASCIRQLNDSTFIIGGEIWVEDSLMHKGFILSLTEDGIINWIDTLGINGDYGVNDVDIDFSVNKINFVGWHYNSAISDKNPFYGRLIISGLLDYEAFEIHTQPREYNYLTNYGSIGKNYIMYNYIDDTPFQEGYELAIGKFTQELYWDNSAMILNYANNDVGGQIIPTNDGGALAVGYISYFGAGGNSVFVIKIGPNDAFPSTAGVPVTNPLVSLNEFTDEETIGIFPNPADENLNIHCEFSEKMNLELLDLNGKIILKSNFYNDININIDSFDPGLYFISVFSDDRKTFVKSKVLIK